MMNEAYKRDLTSLILRQLVNVPVMQILQFNVYSIFKPGSVEYRVPPLTVMDSSYFEPMPFPANTVFELYPGSGTYQTMKHIPRAARRNTDGEKAYFLWCGMWKDRL